MVLPTSTPRPKIVDTTLREGMQAPGVRFTTAQSAEIASALVDLGVDMVECGHPFASSDEMDRVRAVTAACGSVPVLAHARARSDDVESVHATGARWVGVFAGVNDISRRSRIRSEAPVSTLIQRSIECAKRLGLGVRFTVEDASRTSLPDLVAAYRVALDAGADRICFADTVGSLCPWEVENVISKLRLELADPDIEVHFHDDRGLAAANALASVRSGARWISSSINGIGERCGITDTINLLANLNALYGRLLPAGPVMQHASTLVQAHSRLWVDRWRPVVGNNAFTHVAKLHRKAMVEDEATYAWRSPTLFGRSHSLHPQTLPDKRSAWINAKPDVVSATELRFHRHGPGDRYLMLDERTLTDARQYCIVRRIPQLADYGPGHVDRHRHVCDSVFLFLGANDDLTGLRAEVDLGDERFLVESPASVFIPAGVPHSYRVLAGSGVFVNQVHAGDYNSSLLDEPARTPSTPLGTDSTIAAASA